MQFFQDKANVSQSSYQTDSKTGLPVVYLQDQKKALWKKFEALYPNGVKRTSFMNRLANGTHIRYRDDLGGLCLICNNYGYESFENLTDIATKFFSTQELIISYNLFI